MNIIDSLASFKFDTKVLKPNTFVLLHRQGRELSAAVEIKIVCCTAVNSWTGGGISTGSLTTRYSGKVCEELR